MNKQQPQTYKTYESTYDPSYNIPYSSDFDVVEIIEYDEDGLFIEEEFEEDFVPELYLPGLDEVAQA